MIKVAVQMDPLNNLDVKNDSTLAIIEEAIKKKFEVYVYDVKTLSLIDNEPCALAKKVNKIDINSKNPMSTHKHSWIKLNRFDFILIRQDPPFNMQYITATHILEKAKNSIIINDPKSVRNSPEKLLVMDFYDLMPPTLITRNVEKISTFLKEYKKIIIKPLFGNGGKDIFYVTEKDHNFNVIIENFLSGFEHIIIQKFIKKVKFGDKRVLLIDGEPVGAVNRVPNKKEIRANLHIGGLARKTILNEKDIKICDRLRPLLKETGLFFAGIDIIDGYLTEINVTSPTCIREIDYLNKTNISSIFWTEALKKI